MEVHQIASSDSNGETELVLREDFEGGSATGNASIAISDEADKGFTRVGVRVRRFDDVLSERNEAAFPVVKVDIEGHEDFFLRGAKNWLRRERSMILTEVNNWYYEQRKTTSSVAFAQTLPDAYEVALLKVRGISWALERCPVDRLAELPDS